MSERVCFDLKARTAIKNGFDVLANVARVTLGPIGGVVAVERVAQRNRSPELLTDVSTIARRVIEIPDPFQNMGAMLARHLAWRLHEEVGDGSATALIIAQDVITQAMRYEAAGHNMMTLWRGIKKGMVRLLSRLEEMSLPLEEPERIISLATSIVGDERLGQLIEEVFDIVGPQGFIEVRGAYGMESEREYVEGVYWDSGWISPYFADKDNSTQATIERPYILVTDHDLGNAQDLIPVMQAVHKAGGKSLLVIAYGIKDTALNLMVANNAKGTMRLLGLKAPRYGDMRRGVLEDIAITTGARFVRKDAGDLVSNVTIEDLGRARYVVCNRATFTIVGTMGSPQAIRERIRELQQTRDHVDDRDEHKNLDERIGKLLGGTAILHVNGQTESERDQRKEVAQIAIRVVRQGLQGGVVPGGCAAYVSILSALEGARADMLDDEAPALDILRHALVAPIISLARNAGYDPGPVLARVQEAPAGWGFDVIQGKVVDMLEANIVDPLPTVRAALSYGMSAATMAMTTDVLVYRSYRDKTPSFNP